jgi:hypothetical protein
MKTSIAIKKLSTVVTGSAAFLALSNFPANAVSVVRIPQSSFAPQAGLTPLVNLVWVRSTLLMLRRLTAAIP